MFSVGVEGCGGGEGSLRALPFVAWSCVEVHFSMDCLVSFGGKFLLTVLDLDPEHSARSYGCMIAKAML